MLAGKIRRHRVSRMHDFGHRRWYGDELDVKLNEKIV